MPAALLPGWEAAADPSLAQFPLPQTGEGIAECELIQWFVKEVRQPQNRSPSARERCC